MLSGKNKLKALYIFIHRCCSRFTYPWAWFSVSNCKHYKMCLYWQGKPYNNQTNWWNHKFKSILTNTDNSKKVLSDTNIFYYIFPSETATTWHSLRIIFMKIIRKEAVKEARGVRPMRVTTQRKKHKKAWINRRKRNFLQLIQAKNYPEIFIPKTYWENYNISLLPHP